MEYTIEARLVVPIDGEDHAHLWHVQALSWGSAVAQAREAFGPDWVVSEIPTIANWPRRRP